MVKVAPLHIRPIKQSCHWLFFCNSTPPSVSSLNYPNQWIIFIVGYSEEQVAPEGTRNDKHVITYYRWHNTWHFFFSDTDTNTKTLTIS